MEWTLAVAAGASLAAGAVFLRLGARIKTAAASPARPLLWFSVWWAGIGAATLCNGLRVLFGAMGWTVAVVVVLALGIAFTGVAVWGLISFLAYVHTGRRTGALLAGWAYGMLVASTLAYITWSAPHRLVVRSWTVDATAVSAPWGMDVMLTLAFLVPPILAGAWVLRLLPTTGDALQRRRILAVGLGIPLWVLVHLAARISEADAWQFFARVVLGVGVALAISMAYGVGPQPRSAPGLDLQQRVRELI